MITNLCSMFNEAAFFVIVILNVSKIWKRDYVISFVNIKYKYTCTNI